MKTEQEPQIIRLCRDLLAREGVSWEFGITVVAPPGASFRGLGIRPELLCENQSGERVYRVTRKQAKRLIQCWSEHLRAVSEERESVGA